MMFNSATIVTSATLCAPDFHLRAISAVLRTPSFACAARRLSLCRAAIENFRPDLFHRVTQTNSQQRLARILEYVNDLAL
jgi:hypothetical protein